MFSISDGGAAGLDHRHSDPGAKTLKAPEKRYDARKAAGGGRAACASHLLAFVEPNLLGVDGDVNFGLGSFQLQEAVFLTLGTGTQPAPSKRQLVLDVVLQRGHPMSSHR